MPLEGSTKLQIPVLWGGDGMGFGQAKANRRVTIEAYLRTGLETKVWFG